MGYIRDHIIKDLNDSSITDPESVVLLDELEQRWETSSEP